MLAVNFAYVGWWKGGSQSQRRPHMRVPISERTGFWLAFLYGAAFLLWYLLFICRPH